VKRIAVVRVRGSVQVPSTTKDTMRMLGLTRANHCSIVDDRDTTRGMLQKAKDQITWGEVNAEMVTRLIEKRGKFEPKKFKTLKEFVAAYMKFEAELPDAGCQRVFRLSPPRKGYKSIKKTFVNGGDMGGRGAKINDLLARMI
jgi:large subunit ribosomal protein L30